MHDSKDTSDSKNKSDFNVISDNDIDKLGNITEVGELGGTGKPEDPNANDTSTKDISTKDINTENAHLFAELNALRSEVARLKAIEINRVQEQEEFELTLEELKTTEEELRQQNEDILAAYTTLEVERQRYQDLFHLAPDAYVVTNEEGIIQAANQTASMLLATPIEQLLKKPLIVFVAKSDTVKFGRHQYELLKTGEAQIFKVQMYPSSGQPFPASIRVSAVFDETNNTVTLRWLIRDISELERAEELSRLHMQREQVVMRISQRIWQSVNLNEVLQTTVQEVRQMLQTNRVVIVRFQPSWSGTVVAESVEDGWRSILSRTFYDPCFAERYTNPDNQRHITAIDDIYEVDCQSCYVELLSTLQVRACIGVPIFNGNALWGLLIAHHCSAPRYWQTEDIALLEQLATQLTLAVQHAELYEQAQTELHERRRVQAALQESEERFRSLSASAPVGICQTDVQGKCIYANPYWQTLSGLTLDESLGDGWATAIHPDDRARVLAEWTACIQEQREFSGEFRLLTPQGEVRWVHSHGTKLYADTGEILGYVNIDEDITDRKRTEEALKQSEQMYRSLVESQTDLIVRIDLKGRITFANVVACQTFGFELDQWMGQPIAQVVHPDELPDVMANLHLAMQPPYRLTTGEQRAFTVNGIRWFQWEIAAIRNENGQFFELQGVGRDVTERKQAEQALQQAKAELEMRVNERTAELSQTNSQLKRELIYRRRAEQALRQQIERERLTLTLTQHLRQSLHLKNILNTAVTEVRSLLRTDRVLVCQMEPNGTGRVVAEAVAQGWDSLLNQILPADYVLPTNQILPADYSITNTHNAQTSHNLQRSLKLDILQETTSPENTSSGIYVQGNAQDNAQNPIYVIPDQTTYEGLPGLPNQSNSQQIQTRLVVPIVQHKALWGVLLLHQCVESRVWELWEIELLNQLVNQLAIAIQQSELYQQVQEELKGRQQVEAALRQSEALFRSLSESSPLGIFRNDLQGNVLYSNPRAQAIVGCSKTEALGKRWVQFIHPDDLAMAVPQGLAAIREKQEFTTNVRCCHRNGVIRFARINVAPIFSADRDVLGYVGIIEDITEQQAIEQMKLDFISIVSHELRTPLASIRGALGLLASGVLDDDLDAAKQMLKVADAEADRLVRLVNDILDLNRLERRQITLHKQWFDATSLIQQALEVLCPIAEQKAITLVSPPSSIQVWGDRDRIIQTLVNLLSNAIKFSPSNSTVTLSVICRHSDILFTIKDQGRGIPPDKLEAIFGPFQQVDSSDARQKGGTGLGLAICQEIVQQHGGKIWVESAPGEGSKFYFTLPVLNE